MSSLYSAAKAYAHRGWPVHPLQFAMPDGSCSCRNPECGSVGKHPCTPEARAKAVGGRLLGKPVFDPSLLDRSQKSGPARRRFGSRARLSLDAVLGRPLGHRRGVDAETLGHERLRLAAQHPGDCLPPQRFQCGSRSFASRGGK